MRLPSAGSGGGWSRERGAVLTRGRRFLAQAALVERFGAEMPRVMRANPLVQVPGDVLLIGRVLGLLSGIGKQLGSEVDIGAALFPYLAAPSMTAPGGA